MCMETQIVFLKPFQLREDLKVLFSIQAPKDHFALQILVSALLKFYHLLLPFLFFIIVISQWTVL